MGCILPVLTAGPRSGQGRVHSQPEDPRRSCLPAFGPARRPGRAIEQKTASLLSERKQGKPCRCNRTGLSFMVFLYWFSLLLSGQHNYRPDVSGPGEHIYRADFLCLIDFSSTRTSRLIVSGLQKTLVMRSGASFRQDSRKALSLPDLGGFRKITSTLSPLPPSAAYAFLHSHRQTPDCSCHFPGIAPASWVVSRSSPTSRSRLPSFPT